MANRPSDFDITTPTGASSPRQGDNELRKIKTYTQNAYNDLTQASGAGVTHTNLYGTTITADTRFTGLLRGDVEDTNGTTVLDVSEAHLIGSADTWNNERTISVGGAVTGSVSLDGSQDVTLTTHLAGTQDSDVIFSGELTSSNDFNVTGLFNINSVQVTSTAAELNILDGVTATTSELNVLDGITATAAELNTLDGITATTAELNIMDGVTATAAEINRLDLDANTFLGILKVESDDGNADPVVADFTGNVTLIGQY